MDIKNENNSKNVTEILLVIDSELNNLYKDENEDNFENNTLKVTLIIYIIQTLSLKIIRRIRPCAETRFNSLISNFCVNLNEFQDLIYNLCQKEEIWASGGSSSKIQTRRTSIQQFIDFIESYKSGKWNLMKLSLGEIKVFKK